MKNFPTILNVLLLAAVAVLYYLHFTGKTESSRAAALLPALPANSSNIVFVNSGTILEQYGYFKTKKAELEENQQRVKNELKSESTKLQNDAADYQKKAGSMTDQQRQQAEEQLGMRQQQLMQKKEELLGKLDDEQTRTTEELYDRLTSFMKEFNKKKNYQFILGYQKGGGILFANDSLDITKEVLAGLNSQYENEKKENK